MAKSKKSANLGKDGKIKVALDPIKATEAKPPRFINLNMRSGKWFPLAILPVIVRFELERAGGDVAAMFHRLTVEDFDGYTGELPGEELRSKIENKFASRTNAEICVELTVPVRENQEYGEETSSNRISYSEEEAMALLRSASSYAIAYLDYIPSGTKLEDPKKHVQPVKPSAAFSFPLRGPSAKDDSSDICLKTTKEPSDCPDLNDDLLFIPPKNDPGMPTTPPMDTWSKAYFLWNPVQRRWTQIRHPGVYAYWDYKAKEYRLCESVRCIADQPLISLQAARMCNMAWNPSTAMSYFWTDRPQAESLGPSSSRAEPGARVEPFNHESTSRHTAPESQTEDALQSQPEIHYFEGMIYNIDGKDHIAVETLSDGNCMVSSILSQTDRDYDTEACREYRMDMATRLRFQAFGQDVIDASEEDPELPDLDAEEIAGDLARVRLGNDRMDGQLGLDVAVMFALDLSRQIDIYRPLPSNNRVLDLFGSTRTFLGPPSNNHGSTISLLYVGNNHYLALEQASQSQQLVRPAKGIKSTEAETAEQSAEIPAIKKPDEILQEIRRRPARQVPSDLDLRQYLKQEGYRLTVNGIEFEAIPASHNGNSMVASLLFLLNRPHDDQACIEVRNDAQTRMNNGSLGVQLKKDMLAYENLRSFRLRSEWNFTWPRNTAEAMTKWWKTEGFIAYLEEPNLRIFEEYFDISISVITAKSITTSADGQMNIDFQAPFAVSEGDSKRKRLFLLYDGCPVLGVYWSLAKAGKYSSTKGEHVARKQFFEIQDEALRCGTDPSPWRTGNPVDKELYTEARKHGMRVRKVQARGVKVNGEAFALSAARRETLNEYKREVREMLTTEEKAAIARKERAARVPEVWKAKEHSRKPDWKARLRADPVRGVEFNRAVNDHSKQKMLNIKGTAKEDEIAAKVAERVAKKAKKQVAWKEECLNGNGDSDALSVVEQHQNAKGGAPSSHAMQTSPVNVAQSPVFVSDSPPPTSSRNKRKRALIALEGEELDDMNIIPDNRTKKLSKKK